MDDRHDEENRAKALDNEDEYSDSDDGMEVDCVDGRRVVHKLDGELVDSDVNVETADLTSSDVDLSDESDMKGDLTSDDEGSVGHHEMDESAIDSDEETFPLEVKDTKDDDDSLDENDEHEDIDERAPLTKPTSEPEEAEEEEEDEQLEEEEYENDEEDEDDGAEVDAKSSEPATSDDVKEPSDELHESNSVNEDDEDDNYSSSVAARGNETIEPAASTDRKPVANGDSPRSNEHAAHDGGSRNVEESLPPAELESDLEEGNDEAGDRSPQRRDVVSCDTTPNFIGFDPEITNKTLQILYILQQNYQDLVGRLQVARNREENESAMEVDTEQPSQLAGTLSEDASPIDNDNADEEAFERQTDDQAAANKRMKKKRKFFDEFGESETDPSKRLKEQRDEDSGIDANMSENKENFMNSEKVAAVNEEPIVAVPATPSTVAISSPNPPSKAESKSKFDITNPIFKEPFKYGWRREVVYRFISEDGQKKSADISYFTPQGKKLRSIKQINESLPKDGTLHIRNFTFSKELIFRNRESELEVARFTKKMEAELKNESPNVSGVNIIEKRLGLEPTSAPTTPSTATAALSGVDGSAKKPTTELATAPTTPVWPSKKKDSQKSKTNAKTPQSSQGSESASKSKSSSKKSTKSTTDPDAEETTNATPKLTMPKILLRPPNMANSNAAASKVTSAKPSGMKIKIMPPSSKQSGQKSAKKASSSSKSSKNSKSQKRVDKSGAADAEVVDLPVADRSSHANINGRSPNELCTYEGAGNRAPAPAEYHSSFTLSNISRIYDPLLMSLKYLTVRDLLRVSMTSKFLNRIASESCLWKTVRLKNSQVHDWKGFAKALQKYGTKRLDMRKMLCSTVPEELNKMWEDFVQVAPTITSLEHIDFSRTPMDVVDTVAATCPNLAVFNAVYLKNGSLTLDNFTCLKHLVELRLKGVGGIELKRNEPQLHFINQDNLREISLTCVKNIDIELLKTISGASNLITLELGECAKLPSEFVYEIGKLKKLQKLRLEKLDNMAPGYELLTVVKDMDALKSLELINIEVKDGFDQMLAQCKNIENFLIIPLYISQSATTNQLVLDGIKNLSESLKCFVWGLTTELLKVTDLFMHQWQPKSSSSGGGPGANNNASNKKPAGDSIPVRKLVDKPPADGDAAPTHVDILPIPKLERILATNLPKSRIKVIKVPFHMTWRQSLAECMK